LDVGSSDPFFQDFGQCRQKTQVYVDPSAGQMDKASPVRTY